MSTIINNLETNHNRTSDELDKKIINVEIGQNLTLERKIAELENRFDRSLKAVQQQVIRVPNKKGMLVLVLIFIFQIQLVCNM
jgi:ABC-type hemin transport system substrate-binding protein